MGKKNRRVSYDKKALVELTKAIRIVRKEVVDGGLTSLEIDLKKLEEAIYTLPKKERESLEKYFGLIPGTSPIRKMKAPVDRVKKDKAFFDLIVRGQEVVNTLIELEYVSIYDKNANQLVKDIVSKIDKGNLEMSDMNVVRYLLIFLVFIVDGPKMLYEQGCSTLEDKVEEVAKYDMYSTLHSVWVASFSKIDDKAIDLQILIDLINMFYVRDVETMKKFVGLPVSKDYINKELPELRTFRDIRLFKESMFPVGAWNVTTNLIVYSMWQNNKLKKFSSAIRIMKREGWEKMEEYKTDMYQFKTSEGEKEVPLYNIGGLNFTDPYEVMFLSTTPIKV